MVCFGRVDFSNKLQSRATGGKGGECAMTTYQCADCGKLQYSASTRKDKEPCIYCGGKVEISVEEKGDRLNEYQDHTKIITG